MSAQPAELLGYSVEVCRACPLRSEAIAAVVPLLVPEHGLSARELAVVRALAETGDLSNAEIGRRLHLAAPTVKSYLASVHRKLGTSNRTAVAVWAVRNGLA